MYKYDKMWIGMILGLILPSLCAAGIALRELHLIQTEMTLAIFSEIPSLMAPFLQLGAIANLAAFFLFNYIDMPQVQRGLIGSTILLFILVLILNFL